MKIYLIRHARQNDSACNVNVPLSEVGRVQAELLGERLLRYSIDGLYSSDFIRAVETAQIAYQKMQDLDRKITLNHMIREGIREFDFGSLTGKSNDAVNAFYQEFYERHDVLSEDLAYPDGECGRQVAERALPILDEIIHSGLKNVAVVLHGGTIRVILARLFAGDESKRLLFAKSLENCSITELYYDEDRDCFYLERFNDYAHLEHDENLLRRNWS